MRPPLKTAHAGLRPGHEAQPAINQVHAALLGTVEEVLVEGPDQTGKKFTGRTRGNRVCVFDAHPRLVGELVPLRIERASVSTLYGSLALNGVEP